MFVMHNTSYRGNHKYEAIVLMNHTINKGAMMVYGFTLEQV